MTQIAPSINSLNTVSWDLFHWYISISRSSQTANRWTSLSSVVSTMDFVYYSDYENTTNTHRAHNYKHTPTTLYIGVSLLRNSKSTQHMAKHWKQIVCIYIWKTWWKQNSTKTQVHFQTLVIYKMKEREGKPFQDVDDGTGEQEQSFRKLKSNWHETHKQTS